MTTDRPMQLGMVGLGRMGANIVRRLLRDGHECVVFDVEPAAVDLVSGDGALPSGSLEDLVAQLAPPRAVWLMLPAGAVTERAVAEVARLLEPGDAIVDGGNTYYRDDVARAAALAEHGIGYVDVGTSGGVFGLERGFCLMVGGDAGDFARLEPILRSLAPGADAAARTPGRDGEPSTAEEGYLHCGPSGAGHFVKMVHNGIEYGLMGAFAEGLNVLKHADAGIAEGDETPFQHAEFYRYTFDLPSITEVWRRGSVVSSWLLDLTAAALCQDATLDAFAGRVADSGEGRWTAIAAIEEGVPADIMIAALSARFASRGRDTFANQVLSAMRAGFGGHLEAT
jgi:6-phosphogluconate dehydrogenase